MNENLIKLLEKTNTIFQDVRSSYDFNYDNLYLKIKDAIETKEDLLTLTNPLILVDTYKLNELLSLKISNMFQGSIIINYLESK